MGNTPGLWLIGIRRDELDSAGKPRYLSQLQHRFRGRDLKREGRPLLIRDVPYPDYIHDLQKQHGREYVQFYYAEEPLMKAATLAGIKLHTLQLVFGPPERADICATITLPAEYWD